MPLESVASKNLRIKLNKLDAQTPIVATYSELKGVTESECMVNEIELKKSQDKALRQKKLQAAEIVDKKPETLPVRDPALIKREPEKLVMQELNTDEQLDDIFNLLKSRQKKLLEREIDND